MSERRRFTDREKAAIYAAAGGRCQCAGCDACGLHGCDAPLAEGWHADHDFPWSKGGKTRLTNGRALCPPCNRKKGSHVQYRDTFQPRPFQREVVNSVLDGMASGRRTTIVLASPGSGKTLAYQAVATYAYRERLADLIAVFVPRIVLAQQCETDWMARHPVTGAYSGNFELFDDRSRFGKIPHVLNRAPLTPPDQGGVGFVSTYSSLVTSQVFEDWAMEHRGRFLLIADEAQFCGAGENGTRAGALITSLHELAAHTLLLTGTPYRSDGQRLVLAEYDEADEEGKQRLLHNAKADYRDGVREGYLRRFEATLHNARVRWKHVDNTVTEYDLATRGGDLPDVLRKPEVWEPIADGVVAAVREKQKVHPEYRGLISCMEQNDAKRVYRYLVGKYEGLRVHKAISEDGPQSEHELKAFKAKNGGDILVTVRKAFIGYDCKQITVVGILTHYRDWGHLEQLVGRGLRMWDGTAARPQSCRVIAPDDPQMTEFISFMRGESEQGLRERERREREEGADRKAPEQLGYVESAHTTTARAVSNDAELDHDQRVLIEAIKHEIGMSDDVTMLAQFAEKMGLALPRAEVSTEPDAVPVDEIPLTEKEQIKEKGRLTADVVRAILSAQGIYGGRADYEDHAMRVTAEVNKLSFKQSDCRTVEQAQARLDVARRLLESIQ
jgi:superfamily II DNA or RNA helicase